MGLDNYLYLVDDEGNDFLIDNPIAGMCNTYRKYYTLHYWVEEQWEAKGCPVEDGQELVFNQVKFTLNLDDLEDWFHEQDPEFETGSVLDYKNIPDDCDLSEAAFFRGQNRDILKMAREYVEDGHTLVYSSWW